jgi:enoyl-CoA hydratase/carnithine racemase
MQETEVEASIRAIVITGAGERVFCSGADIAEGDQIEMQGDGRAAAQAIASVASASKPVIAALNGHAFGDGALLALSADIRLAATEAMIRFLGASQGVVSGGSVLPRIIGPARAKELLFTSRAVDAFEAERIGLVNRAVGQGALLPEAVKMAEDIALNPTAAIEWTKRVIDAAANPDGAREMEVEANRRLRAAERIREARNT